MEKGMTRLRWLALAAWVFTTGALAQQAAVLGPGPVSAKAPAPKAAPLDQRKLSYAIGYKMGAQLTEGLPPLELPVLLKAIEDAYAKRAPSVSMQDIHTQLGSLDSYMRQQAKAEFQRIAAANARKSAAYLASNREQNGVVQLPSGIQYSVIKRGDGDESPTVSSTVTANYRGMLVDGTEFDSSWAHGAPVSFTVNKVIRGWQDVIPRMHVGDRWRVVIPSQLAYGEYGQPPRIGPNEALVFEIELLSINQP
jgi:FKBP-type peptidyl-prolyl cis-trans isomerase FklB